MEFLIQSRSPLELTAAMQHASSEEGMAEQMVELTKAWQEGGEKTVIFSKTLDFADELGKSVLVYTYTAELTTVKKDNPNEDSDSR